jgi:hypothetical protein
VVVIVLPVVDFVDAVEILLIPNLFDHPVIPHFGASMNGIVNGVCVDPRSYFFYLIGRPEGSGANNWKQVLEGLHASGMRKNPTPHEHPTADAFYGITIMIDAGGNARGRIWLPTAQPDALGYFTREVQVIADAPGGVHGVDFVWAWEENRGAPPYAPVNAPITPPITPPVVPPGVPTTSLLEQALARIEFIEQDLLDLRDLAELLVDELQKFRQEVATRSYSGTVSNRLLGSTSVTLTPK